MVKLNLCINCHYRFNDEDIYCPECGKQRAQEVNEASKLTSVKTISPQAILNDPSIPLNVELNHASSNIQKKTPSNLNIQLNDKTNHISSIKHIHSNSTGLYLYKVVTIEGYLHDVHGERIKESVVEFGISNAYYADKENILKKITSIVNDMFNYYGKQGWEFISQVAVDFRGVQEIADNKKGKTESALSYLSNRLQTELTKHDVGSENIYEKEIIHFVFRRQSIGNDS